MPSSRNSAATPPSAAANRTPGSHWPALAMNDSGSPSGAWFTSTGPVGAGVGTSVVGWVAVVGEIRAGLVGSTLGPGKCPLSPAAGAAGAAGAVEVVGAGETDETTPPAGRTACGLDTAPSQPAGSDAGARSGRSARFANGSPGWSRSGSLSDRIS